MFIAAAGMITVGFIASVIVSQLVPSDKLPETINEMR